MVKKPGIAATIDQRGGTMLAGMHGDLMPSGNSSD
jgi:hypothetical protein